MSEVLELFGRGPEAKVDWSSVVSKCGCPFSGRRCTKTRKSDASVVIGTCTVGHGRSNDPVVICPNRLRERQQVFVDSIHLLAGHEPGNEFHVVPEVVLPGGNVDFMLVSSRGGRVRDFVGIELQSLDTTGAVWPARERFLAARGHGKNPSADKRAFGLNQKMTAKTTLMQLHHKVQTFEHLGKKLVLGAQDRLLDYMRSTFDFSHIRNPASKADPMQFHEYALRPINKGWRMELVARSSTDTAGVARCLNLKTEARVELAMIVKQLQDKMSSTTLLKLV